MKMLRSPFARFCRRSQTRSMNTPSCEPRPAKADSEGGFVLLAVLFLVALILIGLAVAAPKMAKDIQRDKEAELYHRGMQYSRAIRLFYRRTGNYPTDLSQLENTNNIRFLRKRYVDPITGQPFRIIHQGEAKVPSMGLFGQPLGIQQPGTSPVGTPVGGSQPGTANGTSLFSSPTTSSTGTLTDSSATPGTNTSTGIAGTSTGTPGSTDGTSGFGSSGSTGSATVVGRIVGVSSTSPKESIKLYKKQSHYNQWEFVYDPMSEGILGGGQPNLNGPGTTPNPNLSGPGTTTNPSNPTQGTGIGTGSGTGTQTTPPTPQPTSPVAPQ